MARPPDLRRTVFLVGAGVSVDSPSGVPPAVPVIRLFCRWIAGSDEKLAADLESRCKPRYELNPFQFIRFESMLGAVDQIKPGILKALELLEAHGYPNAHHFFLAAAAARGACIITTNFDTRVEMAADWLDADPRSFVLSRRNPAPPSDAQLVKVHGSFPWKGRRPGPRATLNGIGEIGLAFAHYRRFRQWLRQKTDRAHVYVVGYSASDSFDVVPLLEEHCHADRLEWFDFVPGARKLSFRPIEAGDPSALPPPRPSRDFVGLTLARLKGLRPGVRVTRVCGSSLGAYLRHRFAAAYGRQHDVLVSSIMPSGANLTGFVGQNLQELERALTAEPLNADQRGWLLLRLFGEGSFGEAMTRSLDDHQPDVPANVRLPAPTDVGSRAARAAEKRFSKSLDTGDIAAAFVHARDWVRLSGGDDDPELHLMLADSEFNLSKDQGDADGMARARKRAERVSRRSGVVWGLVLVSRMQALEADVLFTRGHQNVRMDVRRREAALARALSFCYFALRTGRADWFIPAVWTAGALQDTLGLYDDAVALHRRLLAWIPEDDHESRGVTLAGLVTFTVTRRKLRQAAHFLRELARIRAAQWPLAKAFWLLARAEYDKALRRLPAALTHLGRAEKFIIARFPEDPWSQLEIIRRMRAAIQRAMTEES